MGGHRTWGGWPQALAGWPQHISRYCREQRCLRGHGWGSAHPMPGLRPLSWHLILSLKTPLKTDTCSKKNLRVAATASGPSVCPENCNLPPVTSFSNTFEGAPPFSVASCRLWGPAQALFPGARGLPNPTPQRFDAPVIQLRAILCVQQMWSRLSPWLTADPLPGMLFLCFSVQPHPLLTLPGPAEMSSRTGVSYFDPSRQRYAMTHAFQCFLTARLVPDTEGEGWTKRDLVPPFLEFTVRLERERQQSDTYTIEHRFRNPN